MKKTLLACCIFNVFAIEANDSTTLYETIEITGETPSPIAVQSVLAIPANDASEKLKWLAGANVNFNGATTGIAQYRGLYGDRVAVKIDGRSLFSAGPNAMDSPLSYVDTGRLESLTVIRGIAPVSVSQESIGSIIQANHKVLNFSDTDRWDFAGEVALRSSSAESLLDVATHFALSQRDHSVQLFASEKSADDLSTPFGDLPSMYDKSSLGFDYGYQSEKSTLRFNYTRNRTDDAVSRALPMDIQFIESDSMQMSLTHKINSLWQIHAQLNGNQTDHVMDNYSLRRDPNMMDAMLRSAYASSKGLAAELHFSFKDQARHLTLGIDYHKSTHDTDISNPTNPRFEVKNFNQVEDQKYGVFIELDSQLEIADQLWQYQIGARIKEIRANAEEVSHHMAMMNPAIAQLQTSFNSGARKVSDLDTDMVVNLHKELSTDWLLNLGLAKKQRAPSYQERYLWMPLQSTGGLADGNTYVGNLNLESESAHQIELGLKYSQSDILFEPRAFYHRIDNYIQGIEVDDPTVIMVSSMMGDSTPLRFANVDARLWGMDSEFSWQVDPAWQVYGILSFVRGQRQDRDDNLYRIAPLSLNLGLNYLSEKWTLSVFLEAVGRQSKVSKINNETQSAGYGIMGLTFDYPVSTNLTLTAGINNLADKGYQPHLAGRNRANTDEIARGAKLPGAGRSGFVSVNWNF